VSKAVGLLAKQFGKYWPRGTILRCQPKDQMTNELNKDLVGSGVEQKARGAPEKKWDADITCI
jgi:hypothetical protein